MYRSNLRYLYKLKRGMEEKIMFRTTNTKINFSNAVGSRYIK